MPKSKLRSSFKSDAKLFLCLMAVMIVGFVPAYAGGVVDLVTTIAGTMFSWVFSLVAALIEFVASLFLDAMGTDLNTLRALDALKGFEIFAEGIRLVATAIAFVIVIWQLFVVLWGPLIGAQQSQSIVAIVVRGLIFVPVTYFIQPLAFGVLGLFQRVYNDFMAVYRSDVHTGAIEFLSSYIDPKTFGSNFLDMSQLSGNILTIIGDEAKDLLGMVIALLVIIVIMWQFVKLLFETAQRFAAMLFYVYLSPLAAACGVGANSMQIAKSSLTLFMSSGILWILNVWSVSVCLKMFAASGRAMQAGSNSFFLWAIVTYGVLKVAQQLDDIFNAVGATNVRMSGSLLDDIISMTRMNEWAGKMLGAAKDGLDYLALNGFVGPDGKNPANPVGPGGPGSKISQTPGQTPNARPAAANASAATQANSVTPRPNGPQAPVLQQNADGSAPRSALQQAKASATNAVMNSPAGKIAQGIKKTGENFSARVNAGAAEASAAANNQALNRMYGALNKDTPEARADAMLQIGKSHPADLNNQAVKDYLGENMGLAQNQKIDSLSVNDKGQLSATIATTDANGNVAKNTISGVNDMAFNANAGKATGAASAGSVSGSAAGVAGAAAMSGAAVGSAVAGSAGAAGAVASGAMAAGTEAADTMAAGAEAGTAAVAGAAGAAGAAAMGNHPDAVGSESPIVGVSAPDTNGGMPMEPGEIPTVSGNPVGSSNSAGMNVPESSAPVAGAGASGSSGAAASSGAGVSGDAAHSNKNTHGAGSNSTSGNGSSEAAPAPVGVSDAVPTRDFTGYNGPVTVDYKRLGGDADSIQITPRNGVRFDDEGHRMTSFDMSVASENGRRDPAVIAAPADMTTQEVASLIAGTASPEVQEHFEKNGGTPYEILGAHARMVMDSNGSRSVVIDGTTVASAGAPETPAASENAGSAGGAGYTGSNVGNSYIPQNSEFTGSYSEYNGSGIGNHGGVDSDNGNAHHPSGFGFSSGNAGGNSVPLNCAVHDSRDDDTDPWENGFPAGVHMFPGGNTRAEMAGMEPSLYKDDFVMGYYDPKVSWSPDFAADVGFIDPSTDKMNMSFMYPQTQGDGSTQPAEGFVQYYGPAGDGKNEYLFGRNRETIGSVTLDENITAEDVAAALMQKNGGGNPAIQAMREQLSLNSEYTDAETKQLREAVQTSIRMKKGVVTSEDAPIKADK